VRGRGDSDGEWEPFVDEGLDGYDTIEWIAGQPWCDGTVGFMGASYGGFVQWAAAAKWRVAQNTVMHTEEQSSHSLAPIVGQSMMPRRQAWP
jgi:putative CocE/NonD family hydrolase